MRIALISLLALAILVSGCTIGGLTFGEKQCQDRECFDDALLECAPASYAASEGETIVTMGTAFQKDLFAGKNTTVKIEGKVGGKCKITASDTLDGETHKWYCYETKPEYVNTGYWECNKA